MDIGPDEEPETPPVKIEATPAELRAHTEFHIERAIERKIEQGELKRVDGGTMGSPDESEVLDLLREHRELFERLAESDLPISEDARRGLARLDAEGTVDE